MNFSHISPLFEKSICDVFEKTTFSEIEIIKKFTLNHFKFNQDYVSKIEFKGEVNGNLFFESSYAFLENITSFMLGLEPKKLNPHQIQDTAKEIINMVMGSLLAKLNEEKKIATLQIPVFHDSREAIKFYTSPQKLTVFKICDMAGDRESQVNRAHLLLEISKS